MEGRGAGRVALVGREGALSKDLSERRNGDVLVSTGSMWKDEKTDMWGWPQDYHEDSSAPWADEMASTSGS